MLFFIYFSFSISLSKSSIRRHKHFFSCNHDLEYLSRLRKINPHKLIQKEEKEDKNPEILRSEVENRKPINVKICTQAIENTDLDNNNCKKIGEVRDGIECREEDILTADKKNVIIETMANAESYISQLVNVTHIDVNFSLGNAIERVSWNNQQNNSTFLFLLLLVHMEKHPQLLHQLLTLI